MYERLGGEAVVRAVVDDFVSRAAADPAVNFRREGHPNSWQPTPQNIERLKQRLVEFIATTAGGPMQYRGNDMVTAHRGMAITNAEFDALAGHLGAALQANDVPRREREELMKAVASTRGAIVEAADVPPADATNTPDTGATDASPPADPAPTDATPPEAPGDGTPPEQTPRVDAPAPETADPNEPGTPSPVDDPKPEGAESAAPEQGAEPTPDPRL